MSIKKFSVMMLSALSLAALLNGCGSSNKESAISAGEVAKVGDSKCVQCHSAVTDKLTGESIIAQYQKSAHYLGGQGCESCHGGGAQHNGVGPIPFATPDAARCATCHDGTTATATNAGQYVNSNHAVLNLQYTATSTSPVCLRCHSHEGAVLFNQKGITGSKTFLATTNATNQMTLDRDGTKFKAINCQTCHEHGGMLRAQKTQDATGNVVAWDPNKNFKSDQFDLCTGCHSYLDNDGTTLIASGTVLPGRTPFIHNDKWNRMIATTHYDDPTTTNNIEGYVIRAKGANPCFDCHGHEAKTETGSTTESTTHTDWAQSGHASKLLTYKAAAVAANPTTNDAQVDAVMAAGGSSSWSAYDWDAGNRATCQRCHTATGSSSFMHNGAVFNADGTSDPTKGYYTEQAFIASTSTDLLRTTKNDKLNLFTHLAGWARSTTGAVTASGQNEALYCWGCHSNSGTGTLHPAKPYSFWFGQTAVAPATVNATSGEIGTLVTYPDAKNSNTCLNCHAGRNDYAGNIKRYKFGYYTTQTIQGQLHYMPAGATLFQKGGYEYDTRSYAAPSYFKHDKIGTIDAPGTGTTAGPCVGCHMTSPNKHKFANVTKDAAGVITAITSTQCATCHTGGFALTAAALQAEKDSSALAVKALRAVLAAKGIHYYYNTADSTDSKNARFYTTAAFTTEYKIWNRVYPGLWRDAMGAASNLRFIKYLDKGAWAHNRFYVKRLIYDSIDFMNDGTLNDDVAAAIDARVAATPATHAEITAAEATAAKAYIFGTGTVRP